MTVLNNKRLVLCDEALRRCGSLLNANVRFLSKLEILTKLDFKTYEYVLNYPNIDGLKYYVNCIEIILLALFMVVMSLSVLNLPKNQITVNIA